MEWSPDRDALRGRVAVVSGATRGAGRGIAAALGEAGATVVCTGQLASEYGFKDLDGSQPDIWRFIEEIRERGLDANPNDYR
jgi:NAD(P)-dependent dehydrogenase (short-subunit alcohol dehydrogenase family)